MNIKQVPEDFIVEEINNIELGEGLFAIIKVTKISYNTEEVAQIIAKKLKIPRKIIQYSGTKDRNAKTTQLFSIKISKEKAINLEKESTNELQFKFLGYSKQSLSLGSLKGNKFVITIRNIAKEFEINTNKVLPNYFGEQRFSTCNAEIGELIIKKEFKRAVILIKETTLKNKQLQNTILENEKDPIKVLRNINKMILMIYLHAYQSKLFNKLLSKYVEKNFSKTFEIEQEQKLCFPKKENNKFVDLKIPLPGFGVEVNDIIKDCYKKLLKHEKINERDFILRSIPGMSLEGTNRNAFINIKNFEFSNFLNDELNENKKKIIVKFELPKGSYATTVLKSLGILYS